MAAQRCVNVTCNKYAKRESVYCGTDCIHQHAKDSLRVLNRYDAKRGKTVSTPYKPYKVCGSVKYSVVYSWVIL